uniref:Metalloendopeptidase n=2 Tax=Strongyloides stercoralis TaxID=6248 RepID=A0A0K0E2B3_STRER
MVLLISIIIFFKIINIFSNKLYESQKQKRSILNDRSRLWVEKEITYYVSSMLDHTFIKVALYRISRETCLTFKHVINYRKALFVYLPGKNYETNLGKGREIPHKIFVSIFYKDIGKIIRETMYSLGVDYEHNRWDRDFFITIYNNSILPGYKKYFEKKNSTFTTTFGLHYDYRSIMHFPPKEYAKRFRMVIYSKSRFMEPFIGKSQYPTFNDAKIINKKYCSYSHIRYPDCLLHGYQHPRIPNTCKCLPFYTGDRCELTLMNDNQCTQDILFIPKQYPKTRILKVGGKCSFVFETQLQKKIKLKFEFINMRQKRGMKCTEENSIEIKTSRDLSVGGYLFCPNSNKLNLLSSHRIVTIVSSLPPSDVQLSVTYMLEN